MADAGWEDLLSSRWIVVCSLSALSCLASASLAWAGHPQERRGFWIGLGAGAGSASATCDNCDGADRWSGFFVKGGGGFSSIDTDFRQGSRTVTVDLGTGVGLIAGAGYDFRVGKNISVTPAVNYWFGWSGDVTLDGTLLTNWKPNVVDFTVGVTFH